MGITGNQMKKALQSCGAYGGQPWSMQELADGANEAAAVMGITTREGLAVLVANCMIESAWYRRTEEYTSQYTPRYDPYRGRTFVMMTFVANYRLTGEYCRSKGLLSDSEYFVRNPRALADYKWAWHGPAAYFTANNLVGRANRGENKAVGRIIHAGPARKVYPRNAMERSREKHITAAYRALLAAGITAPKGAEPEVVLASAGMSVKEVQELVGVTADGIAGPATAAAIKETQSALGITADGIVGKGTATAMASIVDTVNDLKKRIDSLESRALTTSTRVPLGADERKGLGGSRLKDITIPGYLASLAKYNARYREQAK